MAMNSMAPDCPMKGMTATGMSAEGCPQNCCTLNTFNAVLLQTTRDQSKAKVQIPVVALPGAFAVARLEKTAVDSLDRRADSPPIYILNQVFRI
jgi:hypothetical protein